MALKSTVARTARDSPVALAQKDLVVAERRPRSKSNTIGFRYCHESAVQGAATD